jgi:hypothetical protein
MGNEKSSLRPRRLPEREMSAQTACDASAAESAPILKRFED